MLHHPDEGTLDVVIVQHQREGIKLAATAPSSVPSNIANGVAASSLNVNGNGSGGTRTTCRRHQHTCTTRKRHNATQTPDSALMWNQSVTLGSGSGVGLHHSTAAAICCNNCCGLSYDHRNERSTFADIIPADISCHCHITHHCHHYSPGGAGGSGVVIGSGTGGDSVRTGRKRRNSHKKRKRANHIQHHHSNYGNHHHTHHHHHNHSQHQHGGHHYHSRHLPMYNNKSSLESSYEQLTPRRQSKRHQEQQQKPQQSRRSHSPRMQAIAIEIDAATMTEDNTSTATSNFAYKMAADSITPIILAPTHDGVERWQRRRRRRISTHSNTTVETDEMSHDDDDADVDDEEDGDEDKVARRHTNEEDSTTVTPRPICCDNDGKRGCRDNLARGGCSVMRAQNECVKIKRKRFVSTSQDYCSSCSRCSSCSCIHDRTSSCSSIDDFDVDEPQDQLAHEITVAADCHCCNIQRQSTTASTAGEDDDEDAITGINLKIDTKTKHMLTPLPQPLIQDTTTDSSAHNSRRSSGSFCSCNSAASCCYCSCSCDDCEAGHMRTARDEPYTNKCTCSYDDCESTPLRTARDDLSTSKQISSAADFDEQHSSTLTPLTTPSSVVSTPLAEDADVTIRSILSQAFAEDTSSQSQSAEYFSVSSCNQQQQLQKSPATIIPIHNAAKSSNNVPPASASVPPVIADNAGNTTTGAAATCNRKPCKHYSKHHRHKHASSPLDSYL